MNIPYTTPDGWLRELHVSLVNALDRAGARGITELRELGAVEEPRSMQRHLITYLNRRTRRVRRMHTAYHRKGRR